MGIGRGWGFERQEGVEARATQDEENYLQAMMLGIAQSSVKESEIEPGTKSSKKEGLHLGVGR